MAEAAVWQAAVVAAVSVAIVAQHNSSTAIEAVVAVQAAAVAQTSSLSSSST